ncbi:MoaB/Mog domain-containing protein [Trichophaea hybrida]|nr:MoaB/Mog domain-containing protein [Trichophaea hybrida]
MASTSLSVGVLVVSTTAAKDPKTDSSTQLLRGFFEAENDTSGTKYSWKVAESQIVSDDKDAIQSVVREWADVEKLHLIVTTGGTGFAVTDSTPEAVKPLLHKEAPGLVHAMLASSLAITPFAMMSRPIAGVRNSSVIITVPGSPKGAKENLQALIKLLPHACSQAADLTSSRAMHSGGIKKLEKELGVHSHHHSHEGGHHHHHHHHHGGHKTPRSRTMSEQRANKLDDSVTKRYRESPYPMLSVVDATGIVTAATSRLPVIQMLVDENLVGYVLAQDVEAAENVPAYRASIVDGYAVYHTDGAGTYPVVSVSHAAPGTIPLLKPGEVARATAVVMVEDTILKSSTSDGEEEATVEILTSDLEDGENVREVGSDVEAGSIILRSGNTISAVGGEVGLLASVGVSEVSVYRKPTVGVLSTGDEVIPHNRPGGLKLGEVRDTNRPTLLTTIKSAGFPYIDLGIAGDTPEAHESILKDALEKVDVIITTGGVSMGELDLLKPTIEQSLQGTIYFGRVAMKPGKPTTFATVGEKKIFALPGNPASALVTFHLFVLPSLRKAAGYDAFELPKVKVVAEQDLRLDPRPEYHRVFIAMREDGRLGAWSTGGQRSSRIGSAGGANGVVALPAREDVGKKREVRGMIPKGEVVEAILWAQIGGV